MFRRLAIALTLAIGFSALATASAAWADDYGWSGQGSGIQWSKASNWAGGVAPSGSVGTMAFPALSAGVCPTSAGGAPPACYSGDNDLSGISVHALSVDDGVPYWITGNPITLGAGGIKATTSGSTASGASIWTPISLATGQTWTIDGGAGHAGKLFVMGDVTGASSGLAVRLSNGTRLALGGDDEVGPVTITGADAANTGTNAGSNGSVTSGQLNATDTNPVSVTDAALQATATGPVRVVGGEVRSASGGSPPGMMSVAGDVKLDSKSAIEFAVPGDGSDPGPGSSYSQLSASGSVALGGARLELVGGDFELHICPDLPVGEVDTLVSAKGSLTGTFAGLPDGTVVTLPCSHAISPTLRINYLAHAATATVLTSSVYPTATNLTADPAVSTDELVTLTATVNPMSAYVPDHGMPPGFLTFKAGDRVIPGCGSEPAHWVATTPFGGSYGAQCQTSFASSGPIALSVDFRPADPNTWQPSIGAGTLTVLGPPQPTASPGGKPAPTATPAGSQLPDISGPGYSVAGALRGLADAKPKLRIQVTARNGQSRISSVVVRLPAGLRFATGRRVLTSHIHLSTEPKTIRADGRSLLVKLRAAVSRLRMKIDSAALHESASLAAKQSAAAGHDQAGTKPARFTIQLRVGNAAGTLTDLVLVVPFR